MTQPGERIPGAGQPGLPTARHPVRVATDGDFDLAALLALPRPPRTSRPEAHPEAVLRSLGLDATTQAPTPGPQLGDADAQEEAVLHRIETSGAFLPCVVERAQSLTPPDATNWLGLAVHWIERASSRGDLRFLNTACKLLGAVWARRQFAAPGSDWRTGDLSDQIAVVSDQLRDATTQLQDSLARRTISTATPRADRNQPRTQSRPAAEPFRVVVLAGERSMSAWRIAAEAARADVPVSTLCWFVERAGGHRDATNYSDAWYPPEAAEGAQANTVQGLPVRTATTWDEAAHILHQARADVVILTGMPIVPPRVLQVARLGVLNAHNGALPGYRGMDAVGWAILNNDPIICTLHRAQPQVDAGEVLATAAVPVRPLNTLRNRVKATQRRLLVESASHAAAGGALSAGIPQSGAARQFYRLHPHLKRVLDGSPYAAEPRTLESKQNR